MNTDNFVKMLLMYECKLCGEQWLGDNQAFKVEPGERFQLMTVRKPKCVFCLGQPLGRR